MAWNWAWSKKWQSPTLGLMHRYETRLHLMYQRALHNLVLLRAASPSPPAPNPGVPNEPSPISGHSPEGNDTDCTARLGFLAGASGDRNRSVSKNMATIQRRGRLGLLRKAAIAIGIGHLLGRKDTGRHQGQSTHFRPLPGRWGVSTLCYH